MAGTTHAARPPDWIWLRVFHHDDCKDDLLLDGIRPALESAARPAYFKRDWIGGPNILVGLKAGPDGRDLAADVAARITRYLADHPSRAPLTQAQFEAWARPYEQWELQPETARLPLRPDNTVVIETTEPPSPFAYGRDLTDALRAFLCESSTLALDWIAAIRGGACHRSDITLAVMVALAWVAEPEQLRAHMSYRSHAEAFFNASHAGRELRPRFEARYERDREQMRAFMARAVDQLRAGETPLIGVDRFVTLVRHTLLTLADGLKRQQFQAPQFGDILERLSHGDHALLRSVRARYGGLFDLLDTVPAFRAWQMGVSLTYWMFNQLGVRPLERFLACYLVTRTAEELYGQNAAELADYVARTGDVRAVIGFVHASATGSTRATGRASC